MTAVDFYFDPSCPWTWITSRWVCEVAPARDLQVRWRTYSLWHHNEWTENKLPADHCVRLLAQYPGLRVIEAARVAHGDDAVARLYTEFGARIHHDGDTLLDGLTDALAAAGLPVELEAAGEDERWDAVVDASTRDGTALIGVGVGVPIIAVDGGAGRITFFGPVLSPAPTGDAAVRLWDTFVALGEFAGLYEIKRSRDTGPVFGPRP
jgi:DSBA-like thioredoxin domain